MNGILTGLMMFAGQLGSSEKAYLTPMCTAWMNIELTRIKVTKTPEQIAAFIDFALDIVVGEEIFDANALVAKIK